MKTRINIPLFALILAVCLAVPALANAAEPPCFTLLVMGAPEDLTVSFLPSDGTEIPLLPLKRGWESYFRCFYHDGDHSFEQSDMEAGSLTVSSAEEGFSKTFPLTDSLTKRYSNILTLNLSDGTLTESCPAWRNPLLVAMRVLITLITEGAVLWCFGYRKRRTWTIFLVTNLVTQTLLNLSLTGVIPPNGYWFIAFSLGEILIFLTETLVFALGFRERSGWRAAGTAVLANAASLTAGVLLLSYLPM